MARTSLQDLRSLPDALQAWNFDMVVPNIPGSGDTRSLTIKCMSSSIPGFTLDPVLVGLHGAEIKYAGRQVFTHSLPITSVETRDMSTRDAIRNWMETARRNRDNTGNYKSVYATDVKIYLYDDTGAAVRTIMLYGCYPEGVDDSPLDGSNSAAVTFSWTLSYDYHEDI